jgi:hypothetical protein
VFIRGLRQQASVFIRVCGYSIGAAGTFREKQTSQPWVNPGCDNYFI